MGKATYIEEIKPVNLQNAPTIRAMRNFLLKFLGLASRTSQYKKVISTKAKTRENVHTSSTWLPYACADEMSTCGDGEKVLLFHSNSLYAHTSPQLGSFQPRILLIWFLNSQITKKWNWIPIKSMMRYLSLVNDLHKCAIILSRVWWGGGWSSWSWEKFISFEE